MSTEFQKPPDEKLVGHLLTLWIHQNTLVWGRVQLISAIQAAVIGGWYSLFAADKFRYAALLALLGILLSLAVYATIACDLAWRRDIKDRLLKLDDRIFPKVDGSVPGWFLITNAALGFFWLDVVLFAVTVVTKATDAGWVKFCG